MGTQKAAVFLSAALLLGALPLIAAHGDDHMSADMMASAPSAAANASAPHQAPPSYFSHVPYSGWMMVHIASMILGWVFVLPATIMLSVAHSRYSLPAQLVFHLFNGLGVVSGFIYNHATPDLYAGNSHHHLGWIVSSFTVAWTLMSVIVAYGGFAKRRSNQRHAMTMQAMTQHNSMQAFTLDEQTRWSGDSGQGTERNSASLSLGSRQNSSEAIYKPELPQSPFGADDDDEEESEYRGFLGNSRVDRYLSSKVLKVNSRRISSVIRGMHLVLEKFLLLLGFTAVLTGFVTYGGIFRDREVFSGAAHFVKGGIFFWYGLLTLGRWMGAFAEFGWAWNIRPKYPLVARWKTRIPSAEFTESFVIWLYGASNVFLEHLNAWGQAWSAQDFEHLSITALFFGGGLLGMLIESPWIRNLSNASVELQQEDASHHQLPQDPESGDDEAALWRKPATYSLSMNPMPAIVIMILGMLMSSHKQASMTSSMLHAQWGGLFLAFALARAATYITLYLRPPTSHYAARPPSELVAAFCLTAGGIVFKLSAHDVVNSIEASGFHATAVFTVSMGLTGILLSWEVVCLAIKGWAVRKEKM